MAAHRGDGLAGLLAREVVFQGRERGLRLHFPMLVAAGFGGFVVWQMGSPASGPLTAATEGSFLMDSLGGQTVPKSRTVWSLRNIVAAIVMIVVVAVALLLSAPRRGDQWTNMNQPFWAIRLLAIAGLTMRDILGCTTVVLIASGLVVASRLVIVSL
ncbi:TIGR00366 family protein [Brachybacterium sp. AOP43-C2-M15]|uniref:TIGR00366 family protein n=1 Tax=Brachybacterium sp. AOP43-C2-M15 TaxID=3457661 RepID=UPI0040337BF5